MSEHPTLFAVPDLPPEPAPEQHYRSAIIEGPYRYSLARWWSNEAPHDLWVMCNPSTADERVDDATIRRCIGFTRSWGHGGFVVVNLYAWRATRPVDLWGAQAAGEDIVGPDNDEWITAHARVTAEHGGRIIAAWGAIAEADPYRRRHVWELLNHHGRVHCLGLTRAKLPRHPLMLRRDVEPEPFTP